MARHRASWDPPPSAEGRLINPALCRSCSGDQDYWELKNVVIINSFTIYSAANSTNDLKIISKPPLLSNTIFKYISVILNTENLFNSQVWILSPLCLKKIVLFCFHFPTKLVFKSHFPIWIWNLWSIDITLHLNTYLAFLRLWVWPTAVEEGGCTTQMKGKGRENTASNSPKT